MAKLQLMSAVENMKDKMSSEDVDLVEMFLVVDPLKITHYYNFWNDRARDTGISAEEKARFEKNAKMMLDYAERQCSFTCNTVYAESSEESSTPEVKNKVKGTPTGSEIKDNKADTGSGKEDPSKVNLKVTAVHGEDVRHDKVISPDTDRLMREKYKNFVKQVSVDGIRALLGIAYKEGKEADTIEMTKFILSKGLFLGKKCNPWPVDKIDKFLLSCKEEFAKASSKTPAADIDLHKKYAAYLGENAPTILGLRAQTKFDLSNDKVDDAMELATFMLSEALCNNAEGKKWSNTEIENWFKEIKEDMVKNPLTKNEKPSTDVSKIDTSEEKEKSEKKDKTYNVSVVKMYEDIKNQVLNNNVSEEAIKTYILAQIKGNKVELVEKYYNVETPAEELEKMYATYYLSYVAEQFKLKAAKEIDVKAEIAITVKNSVEAGEKTLGKAIARALSIYKEKGENPTPKEVRDIVHEVANQNHPEWYAVLVAATAKDNKNEKTNVVTDKIDFPTKYPEAWNSIKDLNPQSLEDVFTMAKNLEMSQAFPIVSAAIIHFLSTGKIKDKEGKEVKWENAAMELWINTQFTKEETPAEKEAREKKEKETANPTTAVPESPEMKPGANKETAENVPITKVEPETVPKTIEDPQPGSDTPSKETPTSTPDKLGEENGATTNKDKSALMEIPNGAALGTAPENVGDVQSEKSGIKGNKEFPNLGDYVIPAEHAEYKALYHKKSNDWENGFIEIVTKMIAAGKSKKDIKHELADIIKVIANNDAITQTLSRNFKKTSMEDLYKTIESKAKKLEIKGWTELKEE